MSDLIDAMRDEARRRRNEARFLGRGQKQDRERQLAELLELAANRLEASEVVRPAPGFGPRVAQ